MNRDYMNSSRPQISDLDIGTLHQDELQFPQLTDLEVVGVENFEFLRPAGREGDLLYREAGHGAQRGDYGDRLNVAYDGDLPYQTGLDQDQGLWDQEDYL